MSYGETDVTTGSLVPPFSNQHFLIYHTETVFRWTTKKTHPSFYMPLDHVELPCLGYVMPSYVMLNVCMAKHLFFGLESA